MRSCDITVMNQDTVLCTSEQTVEQPVELLVIGEAIALMRLRRLTELQRAAWTRTRPRTWNIVNTSSVKNVYGTRVSIVLWRNLERRR